MLGASAPPKKAHRPLLKTQVLTQSVTKAPQLKKSSSSGILEYPCDQSMTGKTSGQHSAYDVSNLTKDKVASAFLSTKKLKTLISGSHSKPTSPRQD